MVFTKVTKFQRIIIILITVYVNIYTINTASLTMYVGGSVEELLINIIKFNLLTHKLQIMESEQKAKR